MPEMIQCIKDMWEYSFLKQSFDNKRKDKEIEKPTEACCIFLQL